MARGGVRIQMHGCSRGKKAEGNHDQARIWASKVKVRTQLRTRNAITRVSKSPSRSGRPFLACPPLNEYAPRNVREKFVHPWTRVLDQRKKLDPLPFIESSLKRCCHIVVHKTQFYCMRLLYFIINCIHNLHFMLYMYIFKLSI